MLNLMVFYSLRICFILFSAGAHRNGISFATRHGNFRVGCQYLDRRIQNIGGDNQNRVLWYAQFFSATDGQHVPDKLKTCQKGLTFQREHYRLAQG